MTTWTIAINWNRDGDFSDANEDVTSLLISASWVLGTQKPWQDIADNSMLALTLRNDDRLYSPDSTGSPLAGKLVPQRPVRIQSNDGTTTWLPDKRRRERHTDAGGGSTHHERKHGVEFARVARGIVMLQAFRLNASVKNLPRHPVLMDC